jgi:predicted dinucleotide-binding enzyme
VDAGFFTIDLGGLRRGGEVQQIGGPLAGLNLVRLP